MGHIAIPHAGSHTSSLLIKGPKTGRLGMAQPLKTMDLEDHPILDRVSKILC